MTKEIMTAFRVFNFYVVYLFNVLHPRFDDGIIFKVKWNLKYVLLLVNDRNQNFGRYRNFGNFGIGQKSTDTDTEKGCILIPKPIPKPMPKDKEDFISTCSLFYHNGYLAAWTQIRGLQERESSIFLLFYMLNLQIFSVLHDKSSFFSFWSVSAPFQSVSQIFAGRNFGT